MDALTYGLATLVMGEETFGEVPLQFLKRSSPPLQNFTCKGCGAANQVELSERPVQPRKRRRGNHYAQYTRKFSLGNGPTDWVQEYLITKEGGKMLGTLVALAVARMPNLETFAWDMPTGVLRDVWLALSSLGDRPDGKDCCLERVWVRWHDNGDGSILSGGPPVSNSFPPPHPPPPTGTIMPAGAAPFQMGTDSGPSVAEAYSQSPLALSLSRVERPTFSVLPPLKSLSVLDIDELAYLHEMCVLIGRSQQRLRELRVGIALHAEKRTWVTSPIGEDNQLGGVLGTLMRNVHDMRRKTRLESFDIDENLTSQSACPAVPSGTNQDNAVFRDSTQVGIGLCTNLSEEVIGLAPNGDQVDHCNVVEAPEQSGMTSNVDARAITLSKASENSALLEDADNTVSMESHLATSNPSSAVGPAPEISSSDEIEGIMKPFEHSSPHVSIDKPILAPSARTHLPTALCGSSSRQPPLLGKLELEVLELERVPLATPVVQIAFDWALMTSLTILHCPEHEQLWKSLRRAYSPRHSPTSTTNSRSKTLHSSSRPTSTTSILDIGGSEYRMNLKRIHTDAVSSSLINFLKDTLAPNSIEWLFLQEGRPYTSSVTIDAIYRGPLRRHKASLKKLMIDSSDRTLGGRAALNHRWKKWIFNREVLNFVTSGKMSSLRELGMAVDYRDWVSMC